MEIVIIEIKGGGIRHELERSSPYIRCDTWDSWLKNNGFFAGSLRTNYPSGTRFALAS